MKPSLIYQFWENLKARLQDNYLFSIFRTILRNRYLFIRTRLQSYYVLKKIPKEIKSYIMIYGRKDGTGAQVQSKCSAILYARSHGLRYVHTPFEKGHMKTKEELDRWEEFFNLFENEIGTKEIESLGIRSINLMSITSMLLGCLSVKKSTPRLYKKNHFNEYVNRFPNKYAELQDMFRLKYNNSLKEYELHNDPQRINIAVHLRRGDVRPNNWVARFTQNSSIRKGLLKITQILAHLEINHKISIYSQGKLEEFQEFEDVVEDFYLNHDVFSTFHNLVKADVLIMAKSAFSYSAALFSKGIILYEPMWNKPLDKWIINSDGAFEGERFREQVTEYLAVKDSSTE